MAETFLLLPLLNMRATVGRFVTQWKTRTAQCPLLARNRNLQPVVFSEEVVGQATNVRQPYNEPAMGAVLSAGILFS